MEKTEDNSCHRLDNTVVFLSKFGNEKKTQGICDILLCLHPKSVSLIRFSVLSVPYRMREKHLYSTCASTRLLLLFFFQILIMIKSVKKKSTVIESRKKNRQKLLHV